jgi:hypothetical protein
VSDPLVAYLHDHLVASVHAIELVEVLRDEYVGKPLGDFAAELLVEIEADREVLRKLGNQTGADSSGLRDLTAWLSEKVSRLKLGRGAGNGPETFEALEFLELGIQGKWALWRALAAVAAADSRLDGTDFDSLAACAESQQAKNKERRLEMEDVDPGIAV